MKTLNYKTDVLNANKALKTEKASLNGALKLAIHLLPEEYKTQINYFKGLLKDADAYKSFAEKVRKTKSGKYSAFYCLQCWYATNK